MPRCPPESTGFRTAGKAIAAHASSTSVSAAKTTYRGCGTPNIASLPRIEALSVMTFATSRPIPGSPSRAAIAAAGGTARSVETARMPCTPRRDPTSVTRSRSVKSTVSATSQKGKATAFGSPSTATTRWPASRAYRIAGSWDTLAPRKSNVANVSRQPSGATCLTHLRILHLFGACRRTRSKYHCFREESSTGRVS